MNKFRIGFFSFSSCQGCHVPILGCEEELAPYIESMDILTVPQTLAEQKSEQYDFVFVEGSILRRSEIPILEKIRESSSLVVALGACAHMGGVNLYRQQAKTSKSDGSPDPMAARAISDFIKVDLTVPGCPVSKKELLGVINALSHGFIPAPPEYPVCEQCVVRENNCLLTHGKPCLGPVTMGGCEAICPSFRSVCWGCRGTYHDANFAAHRRVMENQKMEKAAIEEAYKIFPVLEPVK